jgi:hypothetical protein
VVFADVRRHLSDFGDRATLITVDTSESPHVVSTIVEPTDTLLRARVGPKTVANLAAHPHVSLVWAAPEGGEYLLIVDGVAEPVGTADESGATAVSIAVRSGILHRLAGAAGQGPSCIALDD